MAHIQSIPVELLFRIFNIVCEGKYISYYNKHSTPRHLKPSLVPVVLVCKYWHDITLAGRYPHFWTTILQLGLGFSYTCDVILQANSFRRCLANSQNSDIVVQLQSTLTDDHMTE